MPIPQYQNTGPVDCNVAPDLSTLKGKSVVVTGGANGLGEGYVRAFHSAGAYVTFGDINVERGQAIEKELGPSCKFINCDTRIWEDQLSMFKSAITHSPSHGVDIVIANAGVTGPDPLYTMDGMCLSSLICVIQPPLTYADPHSEPQKPDLRILNINLIGVTYTLKLGLHYLRMSPESADRDRCFIFKGSIAGILDQPGSFQYSTSKFGLRGLYRSLRRTSWTEGIRVNYVAPWYTPTTILSAQVKERLLSRGVEFSMPEDCTKAMLRIACDKSINGRSLSIVPRSVAKAGFVDSNVDDFEDGSMFGELQKVALAASIRTMAPSVQ